MMLSEGHRWTSVHGDGFAEMSNMTTENEKLRIHFAYCVAILLLAIVAIATDRWSTQAKFTEYLSNAATMTSLMLGLVAIFYSFIANDGLSKSLGNINHVSQAVDESKREISEYLALTRTALAAGERNNEVMSAVSAEVKSKEI